MIPVMPYTPAAGIPFGSSTYHGDPMSIIGLIITIAIVGVILWAVNTLIPMDAKIKQILNVIVIVVLLIWLLQMFVGVGPSLGPIIR